MTTIRDVANDGRFSKSMRAAAGRLTSMGYGNVGVRSGIRSKAENKRAGGAKKSQHLSGNAIDIAGATGWTREQRRDFVAAAAQAGIKGFGLYDSGAVHIDARPGGPQFWGIASPKNPKGHKKSPIGAFPSELQPILASVAKGTAYAPRPKVDVPDVNLPTLDRPQDLAPSLFGARRNEVPAPAPSPGALAYSTPTPSAGALAWDASPPTPTSRPALAAIDRAAPPSLTQGIIPDARTDPRVSVPNMERYAPNRVAPEAFISPEQMAPAQASNSFGALGIQAAPKLDTPSMPMNMGALSGQIMTPDAPYAPALDPSTVAPAVAPAGGLQPALMNPKVNAAPQMVDPSVTGPLPPTDVPALGPPKTITDYPVAEVPQAVPQQQEEAEAWTPPSTPSLTPADVYGGQIGTAAATDGNYVSRDPYGITSVTNKYGVTTGMTPDGKQTAYGSGPNLGALGNLGSVSNFGGGWVAENRNKLTGQVLGGLIGGALFGPVGALAGGYFGGKYGQKKDFPSKPSGGETKYAGKGRWGGTGMSERDARAEWGDRVVDHVNSGKEPTGLW